MECGTKLPDNAKFCFNCGFRLNPEPSQESSTKNSAFNSGETVDLLGSIINLPHNIKEAGQLYEDFHDLAETRVNSFMAHMTHKYEGDLAVFIAKANEDISDLYTEFYQKTLDYLIAHGIYTYDISRIKEIASSYTVLWPKFYQELRSSYSNAVRQAQAEIDYRALRKDNRGRIIGGGFGMGAALKGMIEAGAINAATGMAHSIVNSVGNSKTRQNLEEGKNRVFSNEDIRQQIKIALKHDCTHIYYALLDIYNTEVPSDPLPYYSDQAFLGAASVQAKLVSNEISEENVQTALIGMLKTFPLSVIFYDTAEQLCPEIRSTLHLMAAKCGITFQDAQDKKELFLNNLARRLCSNPFFADNTDLLEQDFFSSLLPIVEKQRQVLGKRICAVSSTDTNYSDIKTQIQTGECPLLFWDRTLGINGKSGLILTDKAIYTHMLFGGFTRTPIEQLDIYIYRRELYLSKAEYDEMGDIWHNKTGFSIDKCSVICEDIYENPTDGTVANFLLNFIIDFILYQKERIPLCASIVEEICKRAGIAPEEFHQTKAAVLERVEPTVDERTSQIDQLVSAILASSFKSIQHDTTNYQHYFFQCGSECPQNMRSPIRELLATQLGETANSEVELFFSYSTSKKMNKDSILLSDKALYIFSSGGDCQRISLVDLKSLEAQKKLLFTSVYANKTVHVPLFLNGKELSEFCQDMMEKVVPFLCNRI